MVGAIGLASIATGWKAGRAYIAARRAFEPSRAKAAWPLGTELASASRVDLPVHGAPGVVVRGWYAPSRNGAAVVLAHGSPGVALDLLPEAKLLARHGYGVVLFDFPGHGASGGPVDWGVPSREALSAAIDFAAARPDVRAGRIGALGFSLGAAVVAAVAAHDARVRAVVLEGAFTTLEAQIRYEYRSWGPVTELPALYAQRAPGMPVDAIRPVDDVAAIAPRPLLLVGGELDPTCAPSMSRALYAAAGEPKELWIVPGAHHGHYADVAAAEYEARLIGFFARALR